MVVTTQKSISWNDLLILTCLVVGWIIKDQSHDSFWLFFGMALGCVFEAIRIVIRKHSKEKSNLWASVLFLVEAMLVFLSVLQPFLLGVAAGLYLPYIIVLIVAKICFRRVISSKDISDEDK